MRLHRLEISGFKSFPDRLELSFDEGVTAIVGPNGCGKSNVVDAITWVLGEQSARSLRGDRMEDVIFSGSDGRRPTPTAEVRLKLAGVTVSSARTTGTIQISDSSGGNGNGQGLHAEALTEAGAAWVPARDIEVARRLYRSGESEYLIDGQACRLRDVQDLLMDAGLGIKAYAVIEQGKIGQILSARPTDRRQLIEEAAGVTKYKTRRRAADLKLEAAQQNLTRVDDIVYEVAKQRGTLKRQAAKARRCRRLRDELRHWEAVLFARRYRGLAQTIESGRARLAEAVASESTAAARVAEVEGRLAALRIELAEAEERATHAREAAHERELEIERRQQLLAFEKQQAVELASAVADVTGELQALTERRGPMTAELDSRRLTAEQVHLACADASDARAAEDVAYAQASDAIATLEADVDAVRAEGYAALTAETALRHAIEHAEAGRERLAGTLSKLEVERSDLQVELEAIETSRQAAAADLGRAQEATEATRRALAARESELAATRLEHDGRDREVRARQHMVAGLKARLQSLEELDSTRAGYGDAARLVLVEGGQLDHLGSVADYLEVDQTYERAVEACLGDLLQAVIVKREEDAAVGLARVRGLDAGRCGFLILDHVATSSAVVAPPLDSLVPVSAVARSSGPHAALIAAGVGEAWIAESLADAQAASRLTDAPVATLAGDVFHGAHFVHGGGREEGRGILATKREIKTLRDQVGVEQDDVDRFLDQISGLEATLARTESTIDALRAERHAEEKTIVGLELRLAHLAEERERLVRKQTLVSVERNLAEEEGVALEARHREAVSSIERTAVERQTLESRLQVVQEQLVQARSTQTTVGDRLAETKATHAALLERAAGLTAEVSRLQESVDELADRVTSRTAELGRLEARREELAGSAVANERRVGESLEAFETAREVARRAEERVIALQGQQEEREAEIREARRSLEDVRGVVNDLQIARATAEADLSHLAATCLDTLQLTLDEVEAKLDDLEREGAPQALSVSSAEGEDAELDEDLEGAARTDPVADFGSQGATSDTVAAPSIEEIIAELRGRIDRLGPVNMMAVEQFDELDTRHRFLTEQRQDLLDAIETTSEAIRRIDRTTRERFTEAFEAIDKHFQETFGTLFGGGRAGLTLIDDSDVLESGIDIVAQPPGKRLQSVQLLSGGEKALVAMALMFAIFKYRPSPFCLLDEIDAPLDDANIGRFIEMLRGLMADTQFILITHNRQTMEIADRLYGVTMEEPGVSRLISLKLN